MTREEILELQRQVLEKRDRSEKEFWENLKPFSDPDMIPEMPVKPIEELSEKYWPIYIKCGAIEKKDLIPGREYLGSCRNASRALWTGECFTYERCKFGMSYEEGIPHFQDDDGRGYDVFIPIKLIEEDEGPEGN